MNAVSLHHIEQRLLADSSSLGKELVLRISPDGGSSEVVNIAALIMVKAFIKINFADDINCNLSQRLVNTQVGEDDK